MEQQALAGRYALGERVGTGGMAEVFAARDTRLGREVAIKLFRPGTADGLERGSAEARMLANLDHPGLVRVLDMDSGEHSGDGAYLVMELVRGPDLGVLLRTRGPLGREGVRLMALDLARTLQYIHGQGIVHRDLKPSNILTRDADPDSGVFRYLLTDFGIARFFDGGRMTATGQVIGSAAYFSPEQARGDGVGRPSDIYSLGLVLIEALTGERAFPGTGIESALARLHRSPSIPHAAGPALSALLVSMTLDDPEDRPEAAQVVQALTVMGPQPARGDDGTEVPAGGPATAEVLPFATDGAVAGTRVDDLHTPTAAVPGPQPTEVERVDHPDAAARHPRLVPALDDDPPAVRPSQERPAGRPRRPRGVVPWLVTLLVLGLLAAAVWAFTAASPGQTPEPEPLPSVPGEPGERLQELYESVQ